jgi:hypothetical protein
VVFGDGVHEARGQLSRVSRGARPARGDAAAAGVTGRVPTGRRVDC